MTIILVLLTLAVFIVLGLVKSSARKAESIKVALPESHVRSIVIDRYYHPSHTWALVGSAEEVTVGADDFAQKILGDLSDVELPVLGSNVKQGEVYASLRRGGKTLPQIAPVSGTIVGVNEKLASKPALVNSSPLEKGWIIKIAPVHLSREIRNLLKGIVADRWQEAVQSQVVQWFSSPSHPVLQDGGRMVDNVSNLIGDAEWERFVQEFFSVPATKQNNSAMDSRT